MSTYKHGIRTNRQATKLAAPAMTDGCIQCVVGTAPVNLAENPYDTVNKPFMFLSKAEAIAGLGYSDDFEKYTLCQSMYACFDVFAVAPVIMINVLDPSKHVKAELSKTYDVNDGKILIEETGVLIDQIQVRPDEESGDVYTPDIDYIASFNEDGTVAIVVTSTGAAADKERLKITFMQIDPSAVTYRDVIGSYDVEARKRTGMELIGRTYQRFGMVPSLLLAPGWSHEPAVNLALNAKAKLISSLFTAKVVSDLDTAQGKADCPENVRDYKNNSAYSERDTIVAWPLVGVGDYRYYFSAQLAALLQRMAADNGGVPSQSPDNKDLKITGLYTAAGEEIVMDMDEANDYLNACGVVTAINMDGWKAWGSNTAVCPSSKDPIDRWINIVTIFDYLENNFKRLFFKNVGDLTDYRMIEEIVYGYNLQLNGLQGSGDIAGGEIVFSHDENPIPEILKGHIKFHTRIGGYAPAEDIENTFEFDPTITEAAMKGGAE